MTFGRLIAATMVLMGCGDTDRIAYPVLPDGAAADVASDTASCTPGRTLCSGMCIDLTTDPSNCGSCNTLCPSGSTCVAGSCYVNDPQP